MFTLSDVLAGCLLKNESLCLDSHDDRITLINSLLSHLDYKTLAKCVYEDENSTCEIRDLDGTPMVVLDTGLTAWDVLPFPSAD